jgi:hypothetical protein
LYVVSKDRKAKCRIIKTQKQIRKEYREYKGILRGTEALMFLASACQDKEIVSHEDGQDWPKHVGAILILFYYMLYFVCVCF